MGTRYAIGYNLNFFFVNTFLWHPEYADIEQTPIYAHILLDDGSF